MELVGAAEVAELLGVSRQRVHAIVASSTDFPAPLAELSAGRVWSKDAIIAWLQRRARGDEIKVVGIAGVSVEMPSEPTDVVRVVEALDQLRPVLLDGRHLSSIAFRRIADTGTGVGLATKATVVEGGRTVLLVPKGRQLTPRQRRAVEDYLERTTSPGQPPRSRQVTSALAHYFETHHGVELGDKTLAELARVASTQATTTGVEAEVRGRDTNSGEAKTVTVKLTDVTRHLG